MLDTWCFYDRAIFLHENNQSSPTIFIYSNYWIMQGRRHFFNYNFSLSFGQFLINKHFFRDDWPQSAYMNSMDVWQIMSYLNVFFVLVEYCLVLWLSKGVPLNDISVNKISPRSRKKMVRSQYIFKLYNNFDCYFFNFREKSKGG